MSNTQIQKQEVNMYVYLGQIGTIVNNRVWKHVMLDKKGRGTTIDMTHTGVYRDFDFVNIKRLEIDVK